MYKMDINDARYFTVIGVVVLEIFSKNDLFYWKQIAYTWDTPYLVMREWLSHDFIDNCHRLKPFSGGKMQFLIIKNDFCKNCISAFRLFVLILICV